MTRRTLDRCRRLFGRIAVVGFLAAVSSAWAEDGFLPASPRLLWPAATGSSGQHEEVLREAGIRCELLTRHGRLLPEGLSTAEKKSLAADLLAAESSGEPLFQDRWAAFPEVDHLVFDGQKYSGGNLAYIDSMLGRQGRPIAFDRELPALLVPLTAEAQMTLAEKRREFQADAANRDSREQADQTFGSETGAGMFADGQFLRSYAGRFDDLYFHLFQNGNGASALAFGALADGLIGRVYQAVNGLRRPGTVPTAPFDLGDILSAGGKAAVRRHLREEQSNRVTEPFQQFAFRILPAIVGKSRTLAAGARLSASDAEIQRALRQPQHVYPTQVPPLYRSPDRFLGWAGSHFIPVANAPALPPGAAEAWYPLPQRDGPTSAASTSEAAASEQLFESSSSPIFVWEDPQLSNLLADPEDQARERKAPNRTAAAADSSDRQVNSDPRRRPPVEHLIAVVTPTADEAREYLAAIAASDERVRTIEQTRGRIRLLQKFLESARPAVAAESTPANTQLSQALIADFDSFARQESELAAALQTALQSRFELRAELENRLRERARPLQALGQKPVEPIAL